MKRKYTVLVGRMVLETTEIEVEVGNPDELEKVALVAAAEIDGDDFRDVCSDNSQTAPFIVGIADHLMIKEFAMDEPPAKQQPLEDMIRDDLEVCLEQFAVTAAIADLADGEGKLIHSEWMGEPSQPDLLISDIASDWISDLSGLTGPAEKMNDLMTNPEVMERHKDKMEEVFGDTIREIISQKPHKPN